MSDFNTKLDEILTRHAIDTLTRDTRIQPNPKHKAKQAITSLIKELVAEAKPMVASRDVIETYLQNGMTQKAAEYHGRNHAIDQFEQNLLKALEEV